MKNILYLDAVGGIAGDMLLSTLSEIYSHPEELNSFLHKIPVNGWDFKCYQKFSHGFRGTGIEFITTEKQPHRKLKDIICIMESADIPSAIKEKIIRTFTLLGEAEAYAHGIDINDIHFHEVGALDTILDISGCCFLLHQLDLSEIYCSSLPIGKGTVRCEHGTIPVPAPALNLLLEGVPIRFTEEAGETVTPTGISLLKAWNCSFSNPPTFKNLKTGIGCGSKEFSIPNILRSFYGTVNSDLSDNIIKIEFTVDDMSGEELGFFRDVIERAPIKDCYFTPIMMKKNRPGTKITILANEFHLEEIKKVIFSHSSTLGFIFTPVQRKIMNRRIESFDTPYGMVRFKSGTINSVVKRKPEYDDLKKIAEEKGFSLSQLKELLIQYNSGDK